MSHPGAQGQICFHVIAGKCATWAVDASESSVFWFRKLAFAFRQSIEAASLARRDVSTILATTQVNDTAGLLTVWSGLLSCVCF